MIIKMLSKNEIDDNKVISYFLKNASYYDNKLEQQ